MTLGEFIRFCYGMIMGTSVPYLKPVERPLLPEKKIEVVNGFELHMGGTQNSAKMTTSENSIIMINAGLAALAKSEAKSGRVESIEVILLNLFQDAFEFSPENGVQKIWVGDGPINDLRKVIGEKTQLAERVATSKKFTFGEFEIHVEPVGAIATSADMVVYESRTRTLFLGALFYNQIHPRLSRGLAVDVASWVKVIKDLLLKFPSDRIVPAEGPVGDNQQVNLFLNYLQDLAGGELDFQACREKYPFQEITGWTSFEENFDLLRNKMKSHV